MGLKSKKVVADDIVVSLVGVFQKYRGRVGAISVVVGAKVLGRRVIVVKETETARVVISRRTCNTLPPAAPQRGALTLAARIMSCEILRSKRGLQIENPLWACIAALAKVCVAKLMKARLREMLFVVRYESMPRSWRTNCGARR